DEFLPSAALAAEQYGDVRVSGPSKEIVQASHRRTRADQITEALRLLERPAETLHLTVQPALLNRALERHCQGTLIRRLGDEVVGAGADGRDRRLEPGGARQDDDRHVRAAAD